MQSRYSRSLPSLKFLLLLPPSAFLRYSTRTWRAMCRTGRRWKMDKPSLTAFTKTSSSRVFLQILRFYIYRIQFCIFNKNPLSAQCRSWMEDWLSPDFTHLVLIMQLWKAWTLWCANKPWISYFWRTRGSILVVNFRGSFISTSSTWLCRHPITVFTFSQVHTDSTFSLKGLTLHSLFLY